MTLRSGAAPVVIPNALRRHPERPLVVILSIAKDLPRKARGGTKRSFASLALPQDDKGRLRSLGMAKEKDAVIPSAPVVIPNAPSLSS